MVKLGIIPYPIFTDEEIKVNNACEPGNQIIDFFESILQEARVKYEIDPSLYVESRFITIVEINNKRVGLLRAISNPNQNYDPEAILKQNNCEIGLICWPNEEQAKIKNIYPIGVPTFGYQTPNYGECFSWSLYEWAQFAVNYQATGNKILTYINLDRDFHPMPGAEKFGSFRPAWLKVIETIKDQYIIDNEITTPQKIFERINKSLVAVVAPGALTFLLDRTPFLLMSAGCAVIMPEITYPLPDGGLISGIHYLKCRDDFTDIPDLLKTPRNHLIQLGINAKKYFSRNLTPINLWKNIESFVNKKTTPTFL